jgi:hypothetical protein
MIFRTHKKPLIMGCLMGLMMLAMTHMLLTSDSNLAGAALFAFIAVHVVLILGLVFLTWWAARFSSSLQVKLAKVHRPTTAHVTAMLAAAAVTVVSAHTVLHWGV